MRITSRWIGLLLIAVLTTSGGVIYGRLSNRWGETTDQLDAGATLARVPLEFGDWKSTAATPIPDYARNELACTGDAVLHYTNDATGEAIGMTIVVGPVGTIAVHKPEICFPSQNYRLLGQRERREVKGADGTTHQFWAVDFEVQDVEAGKVRVYYAWSTGGPWEAPDDPRYHYLGGPYLYKIQSVVSIVPSESGPPLDLMPVFLDEFLPAVGKVLLNGSASQ